MRYNNYEQRVDRMIKAKKFIIRHLILIVCLSVFAFAATVCLCSIKGTVIAGDCPTNFEYGQDFTYKAKAVFNSVKYEFRADGSDEWTSVAPKEAGTYFVRAVSKGLFGSTRYGEEKEFVIEPKNIDVTAKEDAVTYGENPTPTADLAKGDYIECAEFEFDDFTSESTTVKAVKEAVVVKNADGKDVTSSYNVNVVEKKIQFLKRRIQIFVEDKSFVYNAQEFSYSNYQLNDEKALSHTPTKSTASFLLEN